MKIREVTNVGWQRIINIWVFFILCNESVVVLTQYLPELNTLLFYLLHILKRYTDN